MTQSHNERVANLNQIAQQRIRQNDWSALPELADWALDMAIKIQQIPAPTFDEETRARFVASQFRALKLDQITIDDRYNVYGRIVGENPELPAVMISAHTDTVFGQEVDLSIRRETGRICGPGLGDNSVAVAGMLAAARFLRQQQILPPCNLHFVATSREEGLGDLGGMRIAYDRLKDSIRAVLNIEGLAYGFVYNEGTAVRRLKISARADGGHSWVHFGHQSAIHGLIELGQLILKIKVPAEPRTTYNIGVISGGQSINTIAAHAEMWLDMRSEDSRDLARLEEQVRNQIDRLTRDDLSFETEVVGDRPPGRIPADHLLVRMALAVLEAQGANAGLHTGSTDGNIPLSHGCPTITIGMTTGGNGHRTDEYIDVEPIASGIQQLIIMALLAGEHIQDF